MKVRAMPNLAKRTKTAISAPSALKKITNKIPPVAATIKDIIYESLTPNFFMATPEQP